MHPLQQTFRCKLSQITPDGVLRQPEFLTQVFCDHLPVPAQEVEDVLFAMTGEHKTTIARGEVLHEYCTILHDLSCLGTMANRSKHDQNQTAHHPYRRTLSLRHK